MIIHVENQMELTKKLVELTSEFGTVAGYKMNIRKSMDILTMNKQKQTKTPFTTASKILTT